MKYNFISCGLRPEVCRIMELYKAFQITETLSLLEDELPRVIDTPYPYVSIQDIQTVSSVFAYNIPQKIVSNLDDSLQQIAVEFAPEDSTFYKIKASDMYTVLENLAEDEIKRSNKTIGVIHMDRHIGQLQQGCQFTRLNVSRDSRGQLTPRTGSTTSVEQQLQNIISWANNQQLEEVLFIDDVVAFGDTLPVIIQKLHEKGLSKDIKLRAAVGIAASGGAWQGIEKTYEKTGIEVEYLTKVNASPEIPGKSLGMALPVSRDLTLFGGRVTNLKGGLQLIHPYMLPFSKPMPSIIRPEYQIEASQKLLEFSKVIVNTIEEYTEAVLHIGDLIDKNTGIPYTTLRCLNDTMCMPAYDVSLADYLDYSLTILNENKDAILQECLATD